MQCAYSQYVAKLRALAATYSFGVMESLRDQFISHEHVDLCPMFITSSHLKNNATASDVDPISCFHYNCHNMGDMHSFRGWLFVTYDMKEVQ